MHKLSIKGETIVEVMLAIAIAGGVLSGAYYLLNRSYIQSQAAVERAAGVRAAESKVEVLRTIPISTLETKEIGDDFCINSTGQLFDNVVPDNNVPCTVNYKYRVTLVRVNAKTYEITAKWSGLLQPNETATIYYQP